MCACVYVCACVCVCVCVCVCAMHACKVKFINKTMHNTLNGERVGGGVTVGDGKCLAVDL